MNFILELINRNQFILELEMAAFIVIIGLEKRNMWKIRFSLAMISSLIICNAMPEPSSKGFGIALTEYFLILLIGAALIAVTCNIQWKDVVYGISLAYAVQHFASSLYIISMVMIKVDMSLMEWRNSLAGISMVFIIYGLVYSLFYFLIIKKLPEKGEFSVNFKTSTEIFVLVIPIALILSLLEKIYGHSGIDFVICQVYAMLCCFFVLWLQYWQRKSLKYQTEVEVHNQVMRVRQQQYKDSIGNIEIINHKCHDLKYQLEALQYNTNIEEHKKSIDEIKEAINFYDTSLQTENEVLNTVLMEKSLLCKKWGIQMTCLVDGKALHFMNDIDLYTVFGNAIDNAIEAVQKISDEKKRIIAVCIFKKGTMTILQIENYYEHEISDFNKFPKTSKKDTGYHGFGLKSIEKTIQTYGGYMSVKRDQSIFILSIIFPSA